MSASNLEENCTSCLCSLFNMGEIPIQLKIEGKIERFFTALAEIFL